MTSGRLTQVGQSNFGNDSDITITGGSSSAPIVLSNGIVMGLVTAPTLTGNDYNGCFGTSGCVTAARTPADTFHWIVGPATYPFYLSGATVSPVNSSGSSVSVAYAQLAGVVTNQANVTGTVTGTLQVNFNNQSVSTSVNTNVGGVTFSALANNVSMDDGGGFNISNGSGFRHSFTSLTSSAGSSLSGSMNGALMGPGLNGAGIAFGFTEFTSGQRANGTIAFGNPTYNGGAGNVSFAPTELTGYRLGIVASGMNPAGAVTKDGTSSTTLISPDQNYRVDIGVNAVDRTQFVDASFPSPVNPQNALVKFDGSLQVVNNGCASSSGVCNNSNNISVRYALADAVGGGPTAANLPGTPPTARALQAFVDVDTGIRWGRWGGGLINVADRASGTSNGMVPGPGTTATTCPGAGCTNQIDLSVNNWHYLMTGPMSGPVVLPISGTASYAFVGGTSPTAYSAGQTTLDVGTLTSASLTANFTARTVDVALAATSLGSTWSASAANVPIFKDTGFGVEKQLGSTGAPLTVIRNGSQAATAGQIAGGFAGQTGKGAAFGYALNDGGPTGKTLTGVAVFKRPGL
jgi:hypothetical protein